MTVKIDSGQWYVCTQVPSGSGRMRASVHRGESLMGETPEDSELITGAAFPRYVEYWDEYPTEDEAIAAAKEARAS